MCGCCTPIALRIKEARGQHPDEEAADDANVRDGGDVERQGSSPGKEGNEVQGPEMV